MPSNDQLTDLLPDAPDGWQVEGGSKIFGPENLYEYINGGAELYISFGFVQMASVIYSGENQPDIFLDIFDMGSSASAYGVFSHSRERLEQDFGQGSQTSQGLLSFWKDRYYVSILSNPETPGSKIAIKQLAREIEQSIPNEGPLPKILEYLPKAGLIPESIRTFTHHAWINTYYYIAEDNLLNIDRNNEAVLAKYQNGEEKLLLLLVEYTDEIDALNSLEKFVQAFMPEADEDLALRIEDKTWVAAGQIGNLTAVVFQGDTKASALNVLNRLEGD